LGYDAGIRRGADLATSIATNNDEQQTKRLADFVQEWLVPSKVLTYVETVEMVDKFYEDLLNRPISVANAILVAAQPARGKTSDEIAKTIADLRRDAAAKGGRQ
jgi:hypothetical protein